MQITSTAFENNGQIPERYTCDGDNINPPLLINNVPDNTKSFVLIVDDPDAPSGTWNHWILCNIPKDTNFISAGSVPDGAEEGLNSWGNKNWGGPCPPSGEHRYFFKLYALDNELKFDSNSVSKKDIETAIKEHIISESSIVGLYKRG